VRADDLVVGAVSDDLDEADGVAEPLRLAVGGEREGRGLDLVTLVFGLRLGVAHRTDLRLAVGGPWDEVEVDLLRRGPGDGLGGDDSHRLGDVGEHHLGGHVADRVDVLDVGAPMAVDGDGAPLGQFDADVRQAVSLGSGGETDCRQQPVGLQHL
jgi:hypothetical protein